MSGTEIQNMIRCFKCSKGFPNPKELCNHIKHDHSLCGRNEYFCTICSSYSGELWIFKQHLTNCFKKRAALLEDAGHIDESEVFDAFVMQPIEENREMLDYKTELKKSALHFILEMLANTNLTRSVCFDTLAKFQKFLSKVVEGLKRFIFPIAGREYEHIVEDFIATLDSSFEDIRTEPKLRSTLIKADLICPLKRYEIFDDEEEYEETDEDETDEEETDEEETDNEGDDDDEEEEHGEKHEEGNDEEVVSLNVKPVTFSHSPIHFQMKKFFELPNVYEIVKKNTIAIQRQPKLSHFINGELWKEKLKEYKDKEVIPYHLYFDGAQLNNALGTHTRAGLENLGYYIFPTIPHQYQSRLENIFCATFHSAADIKTFGNEKCFNNLTEELCKLAEDGVTLNIKGEEIKVYFVLGLMLGDNLELNGVLGFTKSFNANFCCRLCRIHKKVMHKQFTEISEELRDKANYNNDVLMNDLSKNGVKEYSVFNEVTSFHVVESGGVDLTHDIFEGDLHYNIAEVILYWIHEKKYFTIGELNRRIQMFPYGENEKSNKPPPILNMKKLKKKKFTMSASEMSCFARHLGLIIGNLITDPDDAAWEFYKKTMKFVDLSYLPSYDDEDLDDLANSVECMNKDYVQIFNQKMKFKHHSGTHYKMATKRFGPLKDIDVIRLEGKHRSVKNYSKNSNSRKNLSLSLAKKYQYEFALRLFESEGLRDNIVTNLTKTIWLKDQDYYSRLPPSIYKDQLSERECFSTKKVVVNGIIFSSELWLPDFFDIGNSRINKIVDILLLTLNEIETIFVVCKTYSVTRNEYYGCHLVEIDSLQNELSIININDFLLDHQHPVKVHRVNNNYLFICKRF